MVLYCLNYNFVSVYPTMLESDVTLVEKACDDLKESVSLQKLLGIVLNIGNS